MKQTAIRIKNLSKRYDTSVALSGLSLDIAEGEIFGFLGHNGAGKTTTLHILTTLLKPSSGEAWICGEHVVNSSMAVRAHIGYVPENVRMYPTLTAWDNLKFLASLSGIRKPEAAIRETLDFLECGQLSKMLVGSMSKGQRQRIGLAQAILHRPNVLFLDEPTSGLDPLGIKNLRDLIVRLNREWGTTIFMNTHLLSEVSRTCSSIGVLNQGHLVLHDSLDAVLEKVDSEVELEALYLALTTQKEGSHAQL